MALESLPNQKPYAKISSHAETHLTTCGRDSAISVFIVTIFGKHLIQASLFILSNQQPFLPFSTTNRVDKIIYVIRMQIRTFVKLLLVTNR